MENQIDQPVAPQENMENTQAPPRVWCITEKDIEENNSKTDNGPIYVIVENVVLEEDDDFGQLPTTRVEGL